MRGRHRAAIDTWKESDKADAFQERTDAIAEILTALDDLALSS
jgi:hypothetical protein